MNNQFDIKPHTAGQPMLSVIIPCYNCAPVITRCLDSIDYPDCEILVVNDGSTDNSAEVVEHYAFAHPNVRLINKPNGGASSARDEGIKHAIGKYICFVDADDFLMEGGLARIVLLAEQEHADIVKYLIHHVENKPPFARTNVSSVNMHSEVIEGRGKALLRYDISDYHVVDAVFRRATMVENDVRFQTSLLLHEDDVYMGMFYCQAERVVVTDLPLYCYIHASDYSSTHRQSIEKQRALIDSGWKAATYRSHYVEKHFPQAMPLERLKYMRWVALPMQAIEAQLSLDEYKLVLNHFRSLGVYPLDYRWINVAHWYASPYKKMKYMVKTFLTNHPRLAYLLLEKR